MTGRVRAWVAGQGPLGCLAWGLLLVAFAASFEHLRTFAEAHGQTGWLSVAFALLPDLLTWASLTKLRTERLSPGGRFAVAVTLLLAASGTLSANLSTAKAGADGVVNVADRLAAIAPVLGAILATILAEVRGVPRGAARPAGEAPAPVASEPVFVEPDPVLVPAPVPVPEVPAVGVRPRKAPVKPAVAAPATDADLLAQITALVVAGELDPAAVTTTRVRALLGVGGGRAARLADVWQDEHRRASIRPLPAAQASE